MKKILFAGFVLMTLLISGCTSPKKNGGLESNEQTQNQETGFQEVENKGANQTQVSCKAQEIMENQAFTFGTDELGFCNKQGFEELNDGIYLLVGKGTSEKNPQKLGKEYFNDYKTDSDLSNPSNPDGIKVYLKINPLRSINGFLPGNLPDKNGFINCKTGQEKGENLNCQYCANFFLWKQNISGSGEIGEDLIYVINPTYDFSNVDFQEVTTSITQDLRDYFGDAKVYKIKSFKSEFGCMKK